MQNKKITYLGALLGFVALVGLIFYLVAGKIQKGGPTPPTDEAASEKPAGEVLVSAQLLEESGQSKIEITVQPKDDNPVQLTAFGVRGFITGVNFQNKSALTLTNNPELTENNWQYKITRAEVQSDGQILIEISANHRGDELYTLDSSVVLATIPLTQNYNALPLTIDLDTESTVFAGEDVEVLYPYQSK